MNPDDPTPGDSGGPLPFSTTEWTPKAMASARLANEYVDAVLLNWRKDFMDAWEKTIAEGASKKTAPARWISLPTLCAGRLATGQATENPFHPGFGDVDG